MTILSTFSDQFERSCWHQFHCHLLNLFVHSSNSLVWMWLQVWRLLNPNCCMSIEFPNPDNPIPRPLLWKWWKYSVNFTNLIFWLQSDHTDEIFIMKMNERYTFSTFDHLQNKEIEVLMNRNWFFISEKRVLCVEKI